MTEILNSMKLIKMYAWEKPFLEAVKGNQMYSNFWSRSHFITRYSFMNFIKLHKSLIKLERAVSYCASLSRFDGNVKTERQQDSSPVKKRIFIFKCTPLVRVQYPMYPMYSCGPYC